MRLPDQRRSRAVLLAVGEYTDSSLRNLPEARAAGVALRRALTATNYGTLPAEHCVLVHEDVVIQDVGRTLRTAAGEAEDLLLVYYTGHGLLSRRRHELHLALTGTPSDEPGFGGVPFDLIRDTCLDSPAACKIVILDCCYSGRALGRTQSASTAALQIAHDVVIEGAAVLTSVPPNALSLVLEGEPYPAFSGGMLRLAQDGLPDGPELLTLPVVHHHLVRELKAKGVRLPQVEYTATVGQLAIFRNRAWARAQPVKVAEALELAAPASAAAELAELDTRTAAEVLELVAPRSAADILIAMSEGTFADQVVPLLYEVESALGAQILGSMTASRAGAGLIGLLRQPPTAKTSASVSGKVAQLLCGLDLRHAAALLDGLALMDAVDLLRAVREYPPSAGHDWAARGWTASLFCILAGGTAAELLRHMNDTAAGELLAELEPVRAALLLGGLPGHEGEKLLQNQRPGHATLIRNALRK